MSPIVHFHRNARLSTIVVVAFGLVGLPAAHAQGESELAGAIARADAVSSGEIVYSVAVGNDVGKRADESTLTFNGTSWKRRSYYDVSTVPRGFSEELLRQGINEQTAPPLVGMCETISVSHHGRESEYYSSPQPNGEIRKSARVATGDSPMSEQSPTFPQFLGTILPLRARPFVVANAAKAVRKGVATVDGHEVVVFEWQVSAKDAHKAFGGVNDVTEKGGTLRITVAPKLGFVIPKIEHIGVSGVAGTVITASDFVKQNGLYLPKYGKIEYIHSPTSNFVTEFKVSSIKRINEPIPDSEFIISLPPGTHVADSRDGKQSFLFDVADDRSIPQGMRDVIEAEAPPRPWLTGWKGATLLVLGLGALLLGGSWMVRRVRGRGASA